MKHGHRYDKHPGCAYMTDAINLNIYKYAVLDISAIKGNHWATLIGSGNHSFIGR